MEEKSNDTNNLTKFPETEAANKLEPQKGALPSAFDLFKPSVNVIKNNLVGFLILAAIPTILILIGQGPEMFKGGAFHAGTGGGDASFSGLRSLAGMGGLLSLIAAPGLIMMELSGTRRQVKPWDQALKEGLQLFWRYLGLAILTALILVVSFLLFIVPFFFVMPRVLLAPYFLIDRRMGVMDALKASWNSYKQYKGTWGPIGVFVLIGIASLIPFVGWLITNVLAFLYGPVYAIRYEQIKNLSEGKPARTPIEESPAPTQPAV